MDHKGNTKGTEANQRRKVLGKIYRFLSSIIGAAISSNESAVRTAEITPLYPITQACPMPLVEDAQPEALRRLVEPMQVAVSVAGGARSRWLRRKSPAGYAHAG